MNFSKTFKLHFQGPRFTVGNGYFVRSKGQNSQFERHVETVIKSFKQNFVPRTENGLRDTYLTTFSSKYWNKITPAEKAAHSLSNCKACALNSPKEQKSFPLKPTFIVNENDHVSMKSFIEKDYQNFDSLCKQRTGTFADLANRFPQKLGLRDTDAEVKAAKKATLQECTKQCSGSLQRSSLLAAYTHDISLSKMDKIRKSQCFEPPKPSGTQKKRFPVKSSECSRYNELVAKLKGWDTSCPFVATEVADEFGITGTDKGHKLKLLAIEVNSAIPNLGIQAKKDWQSWKDLKPLFTSGGVCVFDTLKYFKGDKPAAEFEAGISCGGNFSCVGCVCSSSHFTDFAHATSCEQCSLKQNQEVALQGQFGHKPGMLRFYDELNKDELRRELEARGVKDYPTTWKGRMDTLKGILCGVQRVPSLLMFSPESALGDLNLQDYEVLPFEPLHDLKGYLGSVLRKLPSVIQNGALKKKVSIYLDTVWKRAHLYGSDLREVLIEVAYLFVSSPETNDTTAVRKYVMCLVKISKILYSLDVNQSPKQCLQFYNCAFTVHELHLELFGTAMATQYFYALLLHGPQQYEVVCSRSVNTENEERLFKSAANAAKCTDRKPQNMLPTVLKRLKVKRASKMGSIHSICDQNSRIGSRAADLPNYAGSVFPPEWIKKRPFAWQAHLKRIAHFLIHGKGAWWTTSESGNVHFYDGESRSDCHPAGSHVLHAGSSLLEDVTVRSVKCWDDCISLGVHMPIESIRLYNGSGNLISVGPVQPLTEEMDVYLNSSIPTGACLVPPVVSTPVLGVARDPPNVSVSPLPCEEVQSENEVDSTCVGDDEGGFVDMQVSNTTEDTPSEYMSTVCLSLAKLLGHSAQLLVFDQIRTSLKSQTVKLPSELHKHKKLA